MDLKCKTPLVESQKDAIRFIFQNRCCGIRHSTGLGKTYLTIAASILLLKKDIVDVVYVFYPKPALDAFVENFKEHTNIVPFIFSNTSIWDSKAPIILVQSNRIFDVESKIKEDFRRKAVFIDEIQMLKTPTSALSKSFNTLRPLWSVVVGLTASPLSNNIDEIYNICEYLKPGFFGNFWQFRKIYTVMKDRVFKRGGKEYKFKEIVDYKNLDLLKEKVRGLWHTKLIDMPKEWVDYKCELSESERLAYKILVEDIFSTKEFGLRLHELQILVDLFESKVKLVYSLVNSLLLKGLGIIVYFSYIESLEHFSKLDFAGDKLLLTGSVTSNFRRSSIRREFGPGKVLFMTSAGSRSFNFEKGNQVVFYDIPWSVETTVQTIGRVARPLVSKFECIYIHTPYVVSTIDEYKKNLLDINKQLIYNILEGGDPNLSKTLSEYKRKTLSKMKRSTLWRTKVV